jgi:UDP-N-acetylmuramoyl-L-alanyl-D-glutamate--2,6-diaminopimelate ligase
MKVPSDRPPLSPRPADLPSVPLDALAAVAGVPVTGGNAPAVGVTGVTLRSADVRPGDLFLALTGSTAHGASYAEAAARAGAVALYTDPAGAAIIAGQPDAANLPVLISPDPRASIGVVAAEIYHHPSRDVRVVGVTGTSGKTTTCYFLEAALAAAGRRVGLIGTVGARIDGQPVPSALTTPEAPDLQALFAVMRQRGVDTVAMEVSSHALALGRVDGTRFEVGAFTNLTQDHLDFHGDMEHYFAAKRLLFDGRARAEVVVIDDDYGRRLAELRPGAVTVSARADGGADWTVRTESRPDVLGTQRLLLTGPGGELSATIHLPGAFNATNAATALACAQLVGADPRAAAAGLAAVQVPGRMQRIDLGQPFLAIVDYAHKPAAVAAMIAAVREHGVGRVIVVLGAGGDRDHGKRPLMGEIAADAADVVIVTDDNPRSEDPAAIRAQVLSGTRRAAAEVHEIGDRRAAIAAAVAQARPGDAVLIAGKGHELGQEIAGVVHHFLDVEELSAAVAGWVSATGSATR